MSEIVFFPGVTSLDLPVDRVLTVALNSDLNEVIVVGYDKAGEFYFASNKASGPDTLWLLELAKTKLMKIGMND